MELRKYPEADIRTKTDIYFMVGLAIALGVTYAAFSYSTKDEVVVEKLAAPVSDEVEELMDITKQETPPPPPPPPPQTIEVVDDNSDVEEQEFEENEFKQDEEIKPVEFEQVDVKAPTKEPEIFTVVEDMPEFPGGTQAMMNFIAENLEYPPMAKENNIQGRVTIGFVVDETGKIKDVTILKDIGWGCGDEAVKVVKQMPRWKPGKQRNKPVPVRYSLPIKFQLN